MQEQRLPIQTEIVCGFRVAHSLVFNNLEVLSTIYSCNLGIRLLHHKSKESRGLKIDLSKVHILTCSDSVVGFALLPLCAQL